MFTKMWLLISLLLKFFRCLRVYWIWLCIKTTNYIVYGSNSWDLWCNNSLVRCLWWTYLCLRAQYVVAEYYGRICFVLCQVHGFWFKLRTSLSLAILIWKLTELWLKYYDICCDDEWLRERDVDNNSAITLKTLSFYRL